MKRKILSLMIIGAGLIISACEYTPYVEPEVVVPTEPISFSAQIEPIFSTRGCTGCHPSSANLDLKAGNAFSSIMGKPGLVDVANPSASLIVIHPASTGNHYAKYTTQDELLVLTWIEEGAKNN